MVPAVDLSNWNSPYDLYIFDWPQISGGWEKMKREGLAGPRGLGAGIFGGDDVLGLGQAGDEPAPGGAQLPPLGACDFTQGPLVEQVQQALGVPVTGVFDEATCAAWQERYGEVPNAETLAEAVGGEGVCADLLVPVCAEKKLGTGAIIGLSFFALFAGLTLVGSFKR